MDPRPLGDDKGGMAVPGDFEKVLGEGWIAGPLHEGPGRMAHPVPAFAQDGCERPSLSLEGGLGEGLDLHPDDLGRQRLQGHLFEGRARRV